MVPTVFASQTTNPKYPSFHSASAGMVTRYFSDRNLLQPHEHVIDVSPAGDAAPSRNETLRVRTNQRALILKHFCDWPTRRRVPPGASDRFRAECAFHRTARIAGCVEMLAPMLHIDPRLECVIVADVAGPRMDGADTLTPADATALANLLVTLHHRSQSVPPSARYSSEAVVAWQMARLFARPGAGDRRHGAWLARLAALGEGVRYGLEDALAALEKGGTSLVHGDFVWDNWIQPGAARPPRVVDAEFSFFGPAEFDAGTLLASLVHHRQPRAVIEAAVRILSSGFFRYRQPLVAAYAAAQLCLWFEERGHGQPVWRGPSASGVLRRAARAIEGGDLTALLPPA